MQVKLSDTTTIEIDKETHMLIRQYCILNDITSKDFIHDLTNERLKKLKEKMDDMRKIDF